MKKLLLIFCTVYVTATFAQGQFSGISTSKRTGILNGIINPAEFCNLSKKFEVNAIGISLNASNNKIGFWHLFVLIFIALSPFRHWVTCFIDLHILDSMLRFLDQTILKETRFVIKLGGSIPS